MKTKLRLFTLLLAVTFVSILNACKKDPPLPDNTINFEASTVGFGSAATGTAVVTESSINVTLDRAVDVATTYTVTLTPNRITYGTDFTTDPAATNNTLTLTIPAGQTSASFKILKPATVFLNGDESIKFSVAPTSTTIFPGTTVETTLSFSAITSTGSQLTLQGKTTVSPYANTVYADLSANSQTAVDRKSWNLGFASGADFRVILNPAYQGSAIATAKTDITTVTLADADLVANINFNPGEGALTMVDKWDATDLTTTAFAEVSATDANNKVYLVSFEGSKDKDKWFKVKVSRNGTGYKVQYARIGETTIKSIDITKNDDYNFTFVSLETALTTTAIVNAEPRKNSWDIQWAYSTYNSGLNTPYWFQDFILLNFVGGAQATEVLTSTVSYDAFAEANITAITFLKTRDAIGSKWRVTSGTPLGVRTDRFYIIKDPAGNVYKLKFVSIGVGSDGGERGKPVIEYKLVKKA